MKTTYGTLPFLTAHDVGTAMLAIAYVYFSGFSFLSFVKSVCRLRLLILSLVCAPTVFLDTRAYTLEAMCFLGDQLIEIAYSIWPGRDRGVGEFGLSWFALFA